MTTFISMLRGINVGGHKNIKMDVLSKLYESLGYTNVKTYIQSGNVIFDSSSTNIQELTEIIEGKLKGSFDFEVCVVIRTKNEFQNIIENNPFLKEDLSKLYVAFLSGTPIDPSINEIDSIKGDSEKYFISGKEIYLYYPNGVREAKLSNNFFEKKLNVSATTRNWNTVNKLYAMSK
jgi:uncharacterized protein (DUF1697 family)